jgi:hypothetical protein
MSSYNNTNYSNRNSNLQNLGTFALVSGVIALIFGEFSGNRNISKAGAAFLLFGFFSLLIGSLLED